MHTNFNVIKAEQADWSVSHVGKACTSGNAGQRSMGSDSDSCAIRMNLQGPFLMLDMLLATKGSQR